MPARLQAAIADSQAAAERVVGWAQLGVIVLFASLYAFSPRAGGSDMMFQPVPWVLLIYTVFTVTRMWIAWRRPLPGWFLALSVVIDMALLIGLIWSFHIQYDQPAAFYLKAPTLMYVFIFIALRCLRFEPGYVLLAGGAAAAGWLVLLFYALWDGGGMSVITRDYVAYMSGPRVLIGAEVDKIVVILVVTAVLAAGLARARDMLVRAEEEGAARASLARFFAPDIARRIAETGLAIQPGSGVERVAAIMMIDIRGFSRMSERMAPDALMSLLADYQSRLVPVIQAEGGAIDKFLGDGIMATFGAVTPEAGHCAQAMAAAEAVLDTVGLWNDARRRAGQEPVAIGIGIAGGRVVFGAVGDASRLELTVIGAPVNLAAKIEKHNRVAGTVALAEAGVVDAAEATGWRPRRSRLQRLVAAPVDGLDARLDLVAISALPVDQAVAAGRAGDQAGG
ncbi:adenylate cyclase [Tistrella bauzanensis]|uniref:Adenylate cyclase n=1 Tax=Tistrella bauzanensis TaxID=657419 RepID=A0ABQ1IT82_9PROT|nr:adenylate/guanylate cyclase domain-containing protein [Tistrella bauzanensis]GGB51396.1 adenylate cyclase [Tistrella bauzanensis]